MKYERILIINLGGIGDVLLSTPALKALRDHYPGASISMAVVPRLYETAKAFPFVDQVYILRKGYTPAALAKNCVALLALRKNNFDLLLNMRTLVSGGSARKMRCIIDIIHPKVMAGRDTEGRGYFFDIKIPETDAGTKYEREYDIETVEALGVKVQDRAVFFKFPEEDIRYVETILKQHSVSPQDLLVGIHPGGEPSRRWPIENFIKMAQQLNSQLHCAFAVTGWRDEQGLAKALTRHTNAAMVTLTGKLNIQQLGALLSRCNLYISNDTGPMHIAAILRTPLVAIFGPGSLVRYDPRNISDKAIVLHKKAECAPCNLFRCKKLSCLKAISVEEVVNAATIFLAPSH